MPWFCIVNRCTVRSVHELAADIQFICRPSIMDIECLSQSDMQVSLYLSFVFFSANAIQSGFGKVFGGHKAWGECFNGDGELWSGGQLNAYRPAWWVPVLICILKVQLTLSNLDPPIWYFTQLYADNAGVCQKINQYTEFHAMWDSRYRLFVSTDAALSARSCQCQISKGSVLIWRSKRHFKSYRRKKFCVMGL